MNKDFNNNENQLISPKGYKRIRYKKNINKYLTKSNWIIIQFVTQFESKINKFPTAIVVDDTNCMSVINQLPKNKKILIVANKDKVNIIYKVCRLKKLKAWILN